MIATERPDRAGGPDAVTGHLARARAALAHGSDEDRSHVEAIATWCEKGNAAGTDALIDHLDRVPDDAVALLVLAPSIAFAGAGDALPDAWQYVERFTGVHGEAPWYLGCAPTAEPSRASGTTRPTWPTPHSNSIPATATPRMRCRTCTTRPTRMEPG